MRGRGPYVPGSTNKLLFVTGWLNKTKGRTNGCHVVSSGTVYGHANNWIRSAIPGGAASSHSVYPEYVFAKYSNTDVKYAAHV